MPSSKYFSVGYWKAKTKPKNDNSVMRSPEHVVGQSSEEISGSGLTTPRVASEYDLQPAIIKQSEDTSLPSIEPITYQPPESKLQPQNIEGIISQSLRSPSTTILTTHQLQVVSGILPSVPQNTIIMKGGTYSVVDKSTHTSISGDNNNVGQHNLAALQLLSQYSNPDAELNAGARFPPPRCHPGTRQKLLSSALEWLHDSDREKQVYWLYGAAGVGKSAFAQTLAERAKERGILGGTFFFSRPNNRNDPNTVFPTIAHRLAVTQKAYRTRVSMVLAEDSQLLTANFKVQFEELIIKPLRLIQTTEKLLVVLDGLDECKGKDNQCQLVDLVIQAVRSVGNQLPVVWMICSRPERHLKRLLDKEDVQELCWIEEPEVNSSEAEADAERYITSEFERIQEKFSDAVDEEWPGDERLEKIVKASSGLFAFSSTIIRFIDDDNRPDPNGHLDIVIRMLDKSNEKGNDSRNPLELLYKLYNEILEEIPKDVIDDTLLVLHSHQCLKDSGVLSSTTDCFVNLIGLNKGRFNSATGNLHSVLQIVPRIRISLHDPAHLHFYHTSFPDFLKDSTLNQRFHYNAEQITPVIQQKALNILNSDTLRMRLLRSRGTVRTDPVLEGLQRIVLDAFLIFLKFASEQDMDNFDFNKLAYLQHARLYCENKDSEKWRGVWLRAQRTWEDLERKLKEDDPDFNTADVIHIQLLQKMITVFKDNIDAMPPQLFPFEGKPFGALLKNDKKDVCDNLIQAVNNIKKYYSEGMNDKNFEFTFFGCGEKSVICIINSKEAQASFIAAFYFLPLRHPSQIWPEHPEFKVYSAPQPSLYLPSVTPPPEYL